MFLLFEKEKYFNSRRRVMRHMPKGPLVSLIIVVCVVAFDIVCKTEILEPQRKDKEGSCQRKKRWNFERFDVRNTPCNPQSRQSAGLSLQSSNWLPHTFTRRRDCPPPPLWFRGYTVQYTLACGRGVGWGSQSDEGTDTVVL
jgi:hypothetical protein